MAKQGEGLKRVDLKVSVNCCDGCRRKVLKALNLKGVLRTEVHPTADRVAVVGDVDSGRLVKRLAKVGKIAEVIVQPPPEGEKKKCDGGGGGGDKIGSKTSLANEKIAAKGSDDGEDAGKPKHGADDKCAPKGAYAEAKNDTSGNGDAIVKEQQEGSRADTAANGGVSEDYHVKATMCYHRAEPAMAVPMHLPHYAANYTMPLPPPPYAYGIGGCYYGMPPPPYCRPPPVVRPQPTRFVDEDLFSDDNTVGCRVM